MSARTLPGCPSPGGGVALQRGCRRRNASPQTTSQMPSCGGWEKPSLVPWGLKPVAVPGAVTKVRPAAGSQSRVVPSELADARTSSDGWKATEKTAALWPLGSARRASVAASRDRGPRKWCGGPLAPMRRALPGHYDLHVGQMIQ
jgi:hypothetical protein